MDHRRHRFPQTGEVAVARMERSAIRGRSLVLGFYHRARFARAIGSMRATKHRLNGRRPMFALARVKYDPPSRSLRCHLNGMAYIKPPLLHVAFRPRSSLSGLALPTL